MTKNGLIDYVINQVVNPWINWLGGFTDWLVSWLIVDYLINTWVCWLNAAPVGINASAPGDYKLNVTWDKPDELHPYINSSQNSSYISTWHSTKVISLIYEVTCSSNDAPNLKGHTSQEYIVFGKSDGVRAGTDYTCHVRMTVTAHNGTSLGGASLGIILTRTSPASEEVYITTAEGKGKTSFAYHELGPR